MRKNGDIFRFACKDPNQEADIYGILYFINSGTAGIAGIAGTDH